MVCQEVKRAVTDGICDDPSVFRLNPVVAGWRVKDSSWLFPLESNDDMWGPEETLSLSLKRPHSVFLCGDGDLVD